MRCLIITVSLFTTFATIQSSRILGIIATPMYSHQSVFQPVWKALAKRGHDLVVVTTHPLNDLNLPNLKEIDISYIYDVTNQKLGGTCKDKSLSFGFLLRFLEATKLIISKELQDPGVQDLIHNKSLSFDLVMYEYLAPVFGAFAHKFKCPSVGLMSIELTPVQDFMLGNPQHPAVSPFQFLPIYNHLNFYERLQSTVFQFTLPIIADIILHYGFDEYIRTYFGKDYPTIRSYIANVDMVFANANNMFKIPTPKAPNVIEFTGIHIKEPKPLPSNIGTFLNASKTGVVYFSLGTNVKSNLITEKLKNIFLETLTSLPYDVLWKFEEEIVKDNPKIKIVNWAPQQDILRHPNIKAFITQCGIQSLEEALYSNVPVVGLPFCFDQSHNAKMVEYLGIGKTLNYEHLQAPEFKQAIIDVASEPKFKIRIEELARISRDQPMNGVDDIVWWTEYVIRNNGAKHLRSALIDLPWYQYYMLDVLGTFILLILIVVYISYKFYCICFYFLFCKVYLRNKINGLS